MHRAGGVCNPIPASVGRVSTTMAVMAATSTTLDTSGAAVNGTTASALAGAASAAAPVARRPYYWYRIGSGHLQSVRAESEDAARAAILAAHPHARGQRLTIAPVR